MNTLDSSESISSHVISDYRAIADGRTTEVIVTGFAYDAKKAVELIKAAPQIYEALDAALDYMCGLPGDAYNTEHPVILQMKRAAAAARGAVLMSDRIGVKHGS